MPNEFIISESAAFVRSNFPLVASGEDDDGMISLDGRSLRISRSREGEDQAEFFVERIIADSFKGHGVSLQFTGSEGSRSDSVGAAVAICRVAAIDVKKINEWAEMQRTQDSVGSDSDNAPFLRTCLVTAENELGEHSVEIRRIVAPGERYQVYYTLSSILSTVE